MRKEFSLALIAAGAMALLGCASAGAKHVATVSVVTVHSTLTTIRESELLLVCARPASPPAGQCVPEETHRKISGAIARAFELDGKVARLVRDTPVGMPRPAEIGTMLVEIGGIVQNVLSLLPPSPQAQTLKQNLQGVK